MVDMAENKHLLEGAPESPDKEAQAGGHGLEVQPQDSVQLFIAALGEIFPREEIKRHIRVTPHGVFVEAQSFERMVEAYQLWLKKQTGGEVTKSTDKCIKKLFGASEPPQYYLVESKQCMLGFLVCCKIEQPQRFGLPFYLGSLLDTREYLHPRDPHLAGMKHVEVVYRALGPEFRVALKGRHVSVSAEVLKEFCRMAHFSEKLLEKTPHARRSLREGLEVLARLLGKAKEIPEREPILIPAKHRTHKDLKRYRLGSLIFVFEKGEVLCGCYELRGKNYLRMLHGETAALARSCRSGRIGALELPKRRSRYLGSVQVKHHRFLLSLRAFREFVDALMHLSSCYDGFEGPFTVLDGLKKISTVFEGTKAVEAREVMRTVPEFIPRGARLHKKDDWYFVITPKNEIMCCRNTRVECNKRGGRGSRLVRLVKR